MATILHGISIERNDLTGIWDRPVIVKMQGLSIETLQPYHFLTVLDEAGNAINNATVKIIDNNDDTILDTTSNSNGKAYTYVDEYADSPVTLTISKSGYKTYSCKFTLDEKMDWRVSLEFARIQIDQEQLA